MRQDASGAPLRTTVHDPVALFASAPSNAGLFLDFDGVLADISHVSNGAVVRPGIPALLSSLHEKLGRVAIISGRPVHYLAGMIPVEVDIVGLYGLEWRSGGEIRSLSEAEGWRCVVGDLAEAAIAEFGEAMVEHKGLSLTIHYRGDHDRAETIRRWVEQQSAATGVEGRVAKQSFELHPPVSRDKGTVILELADALDPVAFVGDDVGDLPAFDGLDVLARRGVTTMRVVVESDESPREMIDRADHVVAGPEGAELMLRRLVESLGQDRSAARS